MVIPYYCMNTVIIDSFSPQYYGALCKSDLEVEFKSYLKSQLHFNIVTDLYSRHISTYKKAYGHLIGRETDYTSLFLAASWFYQDMSNCYVNTMNKKGTSNIDIFKVMCPDYLDLDNISLVDIQNDLRLILEENKAPKLSLSYMDTLSKFRIQILKELKATETLALSVLFHEYSLELRKRSGENGNKRNKCS